MTMETAISALFDKYNALKRAAEAATEEHEVLHNQWLARSPVPEALRIAYIEHAYPVPACFVRKGWGKDYDMLWICVEGWQASLQYCSDPQLKAVCESKLNLAKKFKADCEAAKIDRGLAAAEESLSEQFQLVDDCEEQITAATPVNANDLRIQSEFLIQDLSFNEPNMETVNHFVRNAVRLAA